MYLQKQHTLKVWPSAVGGMAATARQQRNKGSCGGALNEKKVRSDKSGDPKLTCLDTSSPETTWRPCNLTLKIKTANGMMP